MQGIGNFLERYKNFTTPPLAAARAVRRAVLEVLGIEVSESAVSVRGSTARVAGNGVEKAEIVLNKEKILAETRVLVGDAVKDIR